MNEYFDMSRANLRLALNMIASDKTDAAISAIEHALYHADRAEEQAEADLELHDVVLRDHERMSSELRQLRKWYNDLEAALYDESCDAAQAYATVGRMFALIFLDGFSNSHPVLDECRALLRSQAHKYADNAPALIAEIGLPSHIAARAIEVAAWEQAGCWGSMGIKSDRKDGDDNA